MEGQHGGSTKLVWETVVWKALGVVGLGGSEGVPLLCHLCPPGSSLVRQGRGWPAEMHNTRQSPCGPFQKKAHSFS